MIVPLESISEEALDNIIKEFIFQEGSGYGQESVELDVKVDQVKKQLASGKTCVTYSELHETVTISPRDKYL